MNREREAVAATGEIRAIGFRVAGAEYAVGLEHLRELVEVPRITRVPKAPAYVRGVVNLRGDVLVVLDLARRFGVGETALGPDARVLVLDDGSERVGVLAEAVRRLPPLSEDELEPAPALVRGVAAEYVRGVAHLPGGFVVLVDVGRALAADDARGSGEGDDGGT